MEVQKQQILTEIIEQETIRAILRLLVWTKTIHYYQLNYYPNPYLIISCNICKTREVEEITYYYLERRLSESLHNCIAKECY